MNVKVNIRTIQYDEKGDKDIIDVDAIGKLYKKNEDIYVVYKEVEESNKTTTTIKISKEEISIKRFGQVNSNMTFKKDKTSVTKYTTPQGLFIIETDTKDLSINIKEDYIKLSIDYNIKIMDIFEGKNKIQINIQNIM